MRTRQQHEPLEERPLVQPDEEEAQPAVRRQAAESDADVPLARRALHAGHLPGSVHQRPVPGLVEDV